MKKGLLVCQHHSSKLVTIKINQYILFLRNKIYIIGLPTKLILKECFEVNWATNRLDNLY